MRDTLRTLVIIAACASTFFLGKAAERAELIERPVSAQHSAAGVPGTAFAHETITVSSVAIGFTAATYAPTGTVAKYAECTLETNAIREWPDSTAAPTATVGRPYAVGARFTVYGQNNMRNWRAIRQTNDAVLSCAYYR